jgi:hypothetical protein
MLSLLVGPDPGANMALFLAWAVHLAAGRPWGPWHCPKPCRVGMQLAEDRDEIRRLVRTTRQHFEMGGFGERLRWKSLKQTGIETRMEVAIERDKFDVVIFDPLHIDQSVFANLDKLSTNKDISFICSYELPLSVIAGGMKSIGKVVYNARSVMALLPLISDENRRTFVLDCVRASDTDKPPSVILDINAVRPRSGPSSSRLICVDKVPVFTVRSTIGKIML